MKRSVNAQLRHALLAAIAASTASWALFQIDLGSGFLVGLPDTTPSPYKNGVNIGGNLYGSFDLGEEIHLSVEDQLTSLSTSEGTANQIDAVTGATTKLAAPEQNVPADNRGAIALSYRGFRAEYKNQLFGANRGLEPRERFQKEYFGFSDPTFDYSLKYRRKMQQMFEGEYEFENVRYEADASLHYIVNDITIDSLYQYTSVHSSTLASTSAALSELQGGIRIPEARMKVIAAARILSDFTGSAGFDSYDYSLQVAGDASFLDNELDYRLKTQFYSQGYISDRENYPEEYAVTGFFNTLYLRNNYTLGKGLLLKGLAVVTFNGVIFKQRYDLGLRQAWFNGTSVEGGAFSTMGGLFPLVGYYFRTTLRPIDQLIIGLRLKSVWDWPQRDESVFSLKDRTLFIKAILGGEVAYRIVQPIECYLGGEYTYFNQRTASDLDLGPPKGPIDFPTRLYLGGGVRFNLP
jgi:hypothetical protein